MLLTVVRPTGGYLLDFFCSGIQFYFTVESLSLLGDDALISYGYFMQTEHLCVLIHI